MLVTISAGALQLGRLIFDTPSHEGVERDVAKVRGGPGGNWWNKYRGSRISGGDAAAAVSDRAQCDLSR